MAKVFRTRKEAARKAIIFHLFDREKQLFIEGLNTPTPEELVSDLMPQNTEKRYFRKHANILAAYFGVCEQSISVSLLDRVMSNEIEGEVQPYFLHFLLEAILRNGLRETYTRRVLEK